MFETRILTQTSNIKTSNIKYTEILFKLVHYTQTESSCLT